MKLIDYIHYYLGCPCLEAIKVPGQELKFEPSTVTTRTLFNLQAQLSEVKLGLRRLEDMTRDDMKPIYAHIFSKPFPDSGRIAWFDKEERTAAKRFVMMSGVDRVGIEMTGYMWADCDLSHVKFNPHFISHYLLRQHFDLFGLIDAGLAVDQKTIAQ